MAQTGLISHLPIQTWKPVSDWKSWPFFILKKKHHTVVLTSLLTSHYNVGQSTLTITDIFKSTTQFTLDHLEYPFLMAFVAIFYNAMWSCFRQFWLPSPGSVLEHNLNYAVPKQPTSETQM